MAYLVSYLPFALGLPVLALPVVCAVRPGSRTRVLGLVAASYFFLALCLTTVLWYNALADTSSVLDTACGWFFGAAFLMAWSTAFSAVAIVRTRQP